MGARCLIRPATPADAPLLAELERQCFSDPWSPEGLHEMLNLSNAIALVAHIGETIIGYAIARWAADSGEIVNLAVAPARRRAGTGTQLLDALIDGLRREQVREVFLEVRQSNQAARALYQGRGFGVAGMRRAYYRYPNEDALVLRLGLDGPA